MPDVADVTHKRYYGGVTVIEPSLGSETADLEAILLRKQLTVRLVRAVCDLQPKTQPDAVTGPLRSYRGTDRPPFLDQIGRRA